MSLYKESDSILFIDNIDDIIKKAETYGSQIVEPTNDKLWQILFTVRDFVIEKKRKIYGGFALNKLIELVAPEDKFYDDDNVKEWDLDFYSPDPINDAKEIAIRLLAKGFHHIVSREAIHEETYTVFAETTNCADVSYVPRNIYNKIPFVEINGIYVTGAHFLMIDYFRVLTDPLISFTKFRLEKTFLRLCKMAKHYPLPHNSSKIEIVPPNRDLDVALHKVHEFLINRQTTIVVGMYAYNHLIKESGVTDITKKNIARNQNNTRENKKVKIEDYINYVDINYYEIISTQYKSDARDLIVELKKQFIGSNDRITYQENYPFFQYLGFSVNIYFDSEIICRMYHYNQRCTPYFDVPSLYFKENSYEEHSGTIRIGTFATLMMYNLIDIMKARTDNDQTTKNLYYTLISHMTDLKNYYFEKTGKSIFDESLFQEFIIRCVGETIAAQMDKAIRMDKKRKAGKKYSWSFNPENEKNFDNDSKYQFMNSSGNPINNEKNMKIDLTMGLIKEDIDNINDEYESDEL